MVKERIGDDFDFVEMDCADRLGSCGSAGVADEMDIVAARASSMPSFGGDDARATVSGVTGDAGCA